MSSISTTLVTVPGADEAIPTKELPADTSKTKPAKVAKVRKRSPLTAKTSVPVKQATEKKATSANARKGAGAKAATSGTTKAAIVLKKLRTAKGATIIQLGEATGWQAHSVRGFLSGTVRKKLGMLLLSEIGKDGVRRYRIADGA